MKKSEKAMAVVVISLIGIAVVSHFSRKTTAATGKTAKGSKIVGQESSEDKEKLPGLTSYQSIMAKSQPSKSLSELTYDPFITLIRESRLDSTNLSTIKLEGILWDRDIPLAIINNSILREGDSIDGLTIQRIEKSKVTLIKGDQSYVLEVEEQTQG